MKSSLSQLCIEANSARTIAHFHLAFLFQIGANHVDFMHAVGWWYCYMHDRFDVWYSPLKLAYLWLGAEACCLQGMSGILHASRAIYPVDPDAAQSYSTRDHPSHGFLSRI